MAEFSRVNHPIVNQTNIKATGRSPLQSTSLSNLRRLDLTSIRDVREHLSDAIGQPLSNFQAERMMTIHDSNGDGRLDAPNPNPNPKLTRIRTLTLTSTHTLTLTLNCYPNPKLLPNPQP